MLYSLSFSYVRSLLNPQTKSIFSIEDNRTYFTSAQVLLLGYFTVTLTYGRQTQENT